MVNIHYPVVAAINATAQTVLIALAGAVLCWTKVRSTLRSWMKRGEVC